MNLMITAAAPALGGNASRKRQQDNAEGVKESLTVDYIVRLLRVGAGVHCMT